MGDTSPIKEGFESQVTKLGMSSVSNWESLRREMRIGYLGK